MCAPTNSSRSDISFLSDLPELPSHGILMELHYFCHLFSPSNKKLKTNVLLKKCVDVLFPLCVVSRADRLERRVRGLCTTFESLPTTKQVVFPQKLWRPQPTGILE